MVFDYSAVDSAINEYTEIHSWTKLREVYSGDGSTPPTVLVPPSERQNPGEVYWHEVSVDGKEIGVAIDDTSLLGAGNDYAGLRIRVGYPPGVTDILYVWPGLSKQGAQQTGGVTPTVKTLIERSVITPYQFAELRLEAGSGLTPAISAGKWRSGNTAAHWSGNGPNLTSYVPATSGNAVWVLVSIDANGTTYADAGSEVLASEGFLTNHPPSNFRDGALGVGWIKLEQGFVDLSTAQIIQTANIPALGGASSGLALQPTVINQDYTIPADFEAIWSESIEIGPLGSLTVDGAAYVINP